MCSAELQTKHRNRSSIFFAGGLLIAAGIALGIDDAGRFYQRTIGGKIDMESTLSVFPVGPRGLSREDSQAAKIAWRYFEKNTRSQTGFVDSVAGFPSTTLWDQGSYVFALASARSLDLLSQEDFSARVEKFLYTLKNLPLFEGKLPNKAYNTETLQMVDYKNNATEEGIGWSALDVARLLAGLRVLERKYPEYGESIRGLLASWDLRAMAEKGELKGAVIKDGDIEYPQEGRLGYEQYAARASALWGLDVSQAMSANRVLEWQTVSGIDVPTDTRKHTVFRSITPTLSEPYMLQGLELGLDGEALYLSERVYLAQEARARKTGSNTMVSEDHIDQAPHFLYSSVYSDGAPWSVVTEDGSRHDDKRTVSLKAVYAWDALYNREYTKQLRTELAHLATEDGWFAGVYEADGTDNDVLALNTNAVVLEAIHYMQFGPLWQLQ